jgi:2-dehydro-3-deoxyphosphooctonate aldolase (KDO 8-P synthase)
LRSARIGSITVGEGSPLLLIAGPCVIESRDSALRHGERLAQIARELELGLVFKASYDKANRTSLGSFRGVGMDGGLEILAEVRRELGLPVLADVHETSQIAAVAGAVDVLQTPAFLCRQTDFILAVAGAGKPVNVKKGQFLSPEEMTQVVAKARSTGNPNVLVTERGYSFGYNNLVVDMRAFPILRSLGFPVIYDVTHSLQLPGAGDGVTAGQAEFIEPMACAGVGAGVDGVFMEVHQDPPRAKSDAQNALKLDLLPALLEKLTRIHAIRNRSTVAK